MRDSREDILVGEKYLEKQEGRGLEVQSGEGAVAQSWLTRCDPTDYSPLGSSAREMLQA